MTTDLAVAMEVATFPWPWRLLRADDKERAGEEPAGGHARGAGRHLRLELAHGRCLGALHRAEETMSENTVCG